MEAPKGRNAGRRRYQGTRAIETALITTVLPGFFLPACDAGALHDAKADLQRTTDAAALAASAMLVQDAESGRAVRDNSAGGSGFAPSQTLPDAVSAHILDRGRTVVERRVGILAVPAGVGAGRRLTQTIAESDGQARSQVQGAVAQGTIELRQALSGLGGAQSLRAIRQT